MEIMHQIFKTDSTITDTEKLQINFLRTAYGDSY